MNVTDTSSESWQDYADLVHAWGIEEADANSFTIPCGSHRLIVEIPDGLYPKHYEFFGPLSEEAKPLLAVAVLRNLVRTSVDWEHVLAHEFGPGVHQHLPALVKKLGFPAVSEFIRRKVTAYRQKHPCSRRRIAVVTSPRWQAPILLLGDMRWHFKDQDGPTRRLLDALEAGRDRVSDCWREWVCLNDLDPGQVHEAARYLRKRTGSHLEWYAAVDGRLSWSLRR